MTEAITGGCACGAVRYEAQGPAAAHLHCQCGQCQKRTGTGHASLLAVVGEGNVRATGTLTVWSEVADSGNRKEHRFCPTCGTSVLVTFPHNPAVTVIHASTLDAPEAFAPTFVTFNGRAKPWDRLAEGLTLFPAAAG
jgi:hypothetical protein